MTFHFLFLRYDVRGFLCHLLSSGISIHSTQGFPCFVTSLTPVPEIHTCDFISVSLRIMCQVLTAAVTFIAQLRFSGIPVNQKKVSRDWIRLHSIDTSKDKMLELSRFATPHFVFAMDSVNCFHPG